MDLYKILGVTKSASPERIQKKFRALAMQFHPDRNPGDEEAAAKFKEIEQAYSILSDPIKRQEYNTTGRIDFQPTKKHEYDPFVLDLIKSSIERATEAACQQGLAVEKIDMLGKVREQITLVAQDAHKQLKGVHKAIELHGKLIGRFTTEKDDNILEVLVKVQISEMERIRDQYLKTLETIDKARILLQDYVYGLDQQIDPWTKTKRPALKGKVLEFSNT